MIIPAELIKKKRDGRTLSKDEIDFAVSQFTSGDLPDYQMSALLMAIFIKGLNTEEIHYLTQSMLLSGEVIDFQDLPQFKVDKHSTGGVGDKTSLILAPIVAACGVAVPMISGRGLGHSGGTLDKLESIPGFSTEQSLMRFRELIKTHGLAMIGQTKEICPADKKIYALRDVTGTVESIPLICASIMSKKLAEGIDGLVLDVKFGSGAFMKTQENAELLAHALIDIGKRAGKRVLAFLTDMNQPLGKNIGSSLEVEECLSILKQDTNASQYADTENLSVQLAGAMLHLAGKVTSISDGAALAMRVLENGQAYEKFAAMCKAQGGDIEKLPQAKHKKDFAATQAGFISGFDVEGLGYAAVLLRAGRLKSTDTIDPTAGLICYKKIGDAVTKGEPIFTLHSSVTNLFAMAEERLARSVKFSATTVSRPQLITKIMGVLKEPSDKVSGTSE